MICSLEESVLDISLPLSIFENKWNSLALSTHPTWPLWDLIGYPFRSPKLLCHTLNLRMKPTYISISEDSAARWAVDSVESLHHTSTHESPCSFATYSYLFYFLSQIMACWMDNLKPSLKYVWSFCGSSTSICLHNWCCCCSSSYISFSVFIFMLKAFHS